MFVFERLPRKLRVLAIRSKFKHHGEYSGYKQILKYIQPEIELGIDEESNEHTPVLFKKYQWLFEWKARRFKNDFDVIHLFYGEDYFRFATQWFRNKRVVVTFHQPSHVLEQEVHYGSYRGRVGKLTHLFSKSRFEKLHAAIVTEESQKAVLKKVMPEERIHVIPLGIHYHFFDHDYQKIKNEGITKIPKQLVTVGNWFRNWDELEALANLNVQEGLGYEIHVVNRNLAPELKHRFKALGLVIHENIDDYSLRKLIYQSECMYLPVTAASGNNALFESLAMGTPVLMSDVFQSNFFLPSPAVQFATKNNVADVQQKIQSYLNQSEEEKQKVSDFCRNVAANYDWRVIAERTVAVYEK